MKRKKNNVPVTVKSKVTKRPHLKIMEKLRGKIASKLKEKLGAEFGENIMAALHDKSIDQQIKLLIKQDKLKIFDQNGNQPIYEKEFKEEASKPLEAEKI